MRQPLLASFVLIGLMAATGFAEEPVSDTEIIIGPHALPPRFLTESNAEQSDRTSQHLLKAAEHLELAGFVAEAAELRRTARDRTAHENVLSQKEAELECLQEEVDRLRDLTGQTSTVLIRVVAVEVNRKKLGIWARDFDRMVGLPLGSAAGLTRSVENEPAETEKTHEMSNVVETNPMRLPLFRELLEKRALTILGEPNLTTTSGRPARFVDGGSFPLRVKAANKETSVVNVWFGTQLDVLPMTLPNQRIRLKTSVEFRQRRGDEVVDDKGNSHSGISALGLSTEVEMQLGQTLTLGQLKASRSGNHETASDNEKLKRPSRAAYQADEFGEATEFIVFVTPELVNSPNRHRPLEAVPAATEVGDERLESIAPAAFAPLDWNLFGPVMPVLKRTTNRE